MNDITFNTHTLPSLVLVAIISTFVIIGLMTLAMALKDKLDFTKNENSKRKIGVSLFVVSIVFVVAAVSFIFVPSHYYKPNAYSTGSVITKVVTIDDFNKTMKKDYNLDFKGKLKNNRSGKQVFYTITDLKTNKKYENCTLGFKKISDNKIKLSEINCAENVMPDILKNKIR